jgi:D-serine deaminase-like pyridoxal phosphate-dependent protein
MNRRTFLAATASTGVVSGVNPANSPAAADHVLDPAWRSKATLPTPAILLDLDAFETNLQRMADHCRQAGCGFRPHTKTHKCPEIARRQIASGALGVSVATVSEAEAMVSAGIRGVLLTSPVVDAAKIARLVDLARRGGELLLAVGHAREAELLAESAEAARVRIDVLVDLDVGDRRTGSLPGEPALELARRIAQSKSLRLRGVQAYAGHASHTVGFEARRRTSREAMAKAVETRALFDKAGFQTTILSGGSTGTYNIDSAIQGVTELQVGSYIFMDVDYRRIGASSGDALYTDFQPSLTVLTSVISATHPDRITVDAGTKAIDTTTTHRPEPKHLPGLLYIRAGDEFGAVTAESSARLPKLGERIEFIVPHCDPTVNLYDRIYCCRGDKVEAIWPIMARREFAAASSTAK